MKLTSTTLASALLITSAFAAPAAPVEERASKSDSGTIDDGETGIRAFIGYKGNWVHLKNQGKVFYDGTESYTHDKDGSFFFYPFDSKTVKIYAAKKADRGKFDVSIDGKYVGTGDAHGKCTGSQCHPELIFEYDNVPANALQVTVVNRASDSRLPKGSVPYLAVDKIVYSGYEGKN